MKIYALSRMRFLKYLRKGTIQMGNNLYYNLLKVIDTPQYFDKKRPIHYESVFFLSKY